jgi:hypothetical protein
MAALPDVSFASGTGIDADFRKNLPKAHRAMGCLSSKVGWTRSKAYPKVILVRQKRTFSDTSSLTEFFGCCRENWAKLISYSHRWILWGEHLVYNTSISTGPAYHCRLLSIDPAYYVRNLPLENNRFDAPSNGFNGGVKAFGSRGANLLSKNNYYSCSVCTGQNGVKFQSDTFINAQLQMQADANYDHCLFENMSFILEFLTKSSWQ